MVAILNAFLDFLFAPAIAVGEVYAIASASIFVSFVFAATQALMIDKNKLKVLKEEMKIAQKKQKDAQKNNDPSALKKSFDEILRLQNRQMMMTFKPLMISLLPVLAIFSWVPTLYSGTPFALPFWIPFAGSSVGWLGLYIIISLPSATFFRKMLGMD